MPSRSASPFLSPPANRPQAILVLGLAGFLANASHLPLYFGVDFLWGSIFSLLAVWIFGTRWGALVALIAYSYTVSLWGHWWALPVFVLEAIWVGWLLQRRSLNIVAADTLFWLLIGMPLIWLAYRFALDTSAQLSLVVMLKDAVNGIFNALVASLILTYARQGFAQIGLPPRRDRPQNNTLSHTLFNLLVGCVLVPALFFTIIDARQERRETLASINENLQAHASSSAAGLRAWHESNLRALKRVAASPNAQNSVQNNARRPKSTPEFRAILQTSLQTQGDFQGIRVFDAQGKTVAFAPRPGARRAVTNAANSTASRAEIASFQAVKKAQRAVFSSVETPTSAAPAATMGVPILRRGRFAGVVCAGLDTSRIRRRLTRRLAGSGLQSTIVDRRGVVASSESQLASGASYPYPASPAASFSAPPIARATGAATYQWMPQGATQGALHWQKSSSIRRVPLEDLPWTLYVRAPFAPYQERLNRVYVFDLAMILALSVGAMLLAAVISRNLARPLQQLASVSTDLPAQLMQPKSPARVWPHSSIAEIDVLARNFRDMEQTLRDRIGDIQQARWALAEESARLVEANRLKDDFLAVLSHELRTPLVPILGYADLLSAGSLDAEQTAESARAIERNARVQLRLIEDLLDVTSIMSGKMHLALGIADLPAITRAAIEASAFAAQAKNIEITAELDETLPRTQGDPARLQQVVWNMISNSIKFSPPDGKVRVQVGRLEGSGDVAQIRVSDNGMGISAQFLPHVFDRFRQAESHLTRTAGGLGLGLFIVRRIVELHNGTIEVFSDGEDKGTTFVVTLPLKKLVI